MLNRVHSDLPVDVEETMERAIGVCIEVHKHLGPGFLESAYHRALGIELRLRGIPFAEEHAIEVVYKSHRLSGHRLDLVIDARVVLEVKAVAQIEEIHVSQVVAYLKATGLRGGLVVNFNATVLKNGIRRVVR